MSAVFEGEARCFNCEYMAGTPSLAPAISWALGKLPKTFVCTHAPAEQVWQVGAKLRDFNYVSGACIVYFHRMTHFDDTKPLICAEVFLALSLVYSRAG